MDCTLNVPATCLWSEVMLEQVWAPTDAILYLWFQEHCVSQGLLSFYRNTFVSGVLLISDNANAGMATDSVLARLKRLGQGYLHPAAGLAAMQAVLHSMALASPSPAIVAVNPFDWPTYTANMPAVPHFFTVVAGVGPSTPVATAQQGSQQSAVVPGTAAVSQELVLGQVQAALQGVLGGSIGVEEPLMSAGLDSLGSVEFANVLSRQFGMQMPGTLVFDYPTVNAISAYLFDKLAAAAPLPEAATAEAASVSQPPVSLPTPWSISQQHQQMPTAVAVMATAFHPIRTAAHSCGTFPWDQDHITTIPDARWDADSALSQGHSMQARFGSFMEGVELFDSTSFGLSAGEASTMDPQQRCLLQCAAEALHDRQQRSGWSQTSAGSLLTSSMSKAGVFIGISWTEYAKMAGMHQAPVGAYTAQSAVLSVAAGNPAASLHTL